MNVKLMLVTDAGEVLDSTDSMTADEWNDTRLGPIAAHALLQELPRVIEPIPYAVLERNLEDMPRSATF